MRKEEALLLLLLTLSICVGVQAQVTFGFDQTTYSVREDAGNVSISVSMINGSISGDEILTLSIAATGGTATAGGDFIPVITDLTFSSTNTSISQTVTIAILDDLLLEDFETFNLTLTAANDNSNATLPDPVTVTIEDVDGITVGFGFCPASYSVTENAGRVNITVEILKGTPVRDVIVTLQSEDSSARAGLDYEAINTNLTFNVYMPTQTITIPILDDLIVEGSTEVFRLILATTDSAVTLEIQTATVYIRDDDRVTIGFNQTTNMPSVSEGAGSVIMTVNVLNGTLARSVSVFISYARSSDYSVTPSRTLTFNDATGSQTVTVSIQDDTLVENQYESFSINLWTHDSAVILKTRGARVTIEDNDMVTIGFRRTYSVREDSGNIGVVASVLRNSLARTAVVTFSTLDNTARAGTDYTIVSRTLIFSAAVTTQVIQIPIINDLTVEHSEIISLTLMSADPAVILNPSTSTVTITDEDVVTIGFNKTAYSLSEGMSSAIVTLSVQNGTLDRDVIVTLSTINGTAMPGEEYTPVSTNVSFNASTSTQTVDIPILDNMIVADSTAFSVALSSADTAAILNPANANITIEDEDMITIRFHPTTYTVAESAGSVNVVVNMLNGTLVRDVHVFLMTSLTDGTATATSDYTVTSGDLIFNATTSSLMVTIPILEDSIVEGSETIIVTLTSADPAILSPPSTCVTIEDNDEFTIGFSLTTYSVSEDVGNVSVAVSLLSGTLARDATVTLQTLNNTALARMDFQDTSIDLTFNSSSSTQTAMVSIINDAVLEDTLEYFSLILTSTDSALTLHPMTANISIRDDIDMVTIGFDPVSYFVLEGTGTVNVTVSILNGTLARNIEVFVSVLSAGTTTADREADYTAVKIAMTFGATISTQMATVPILNGSAVEFINLVLTSMDNAALVNPATARINIEDTVQIGFENPFYVVAEDSGNVTVCATATGQLVRDTIVTLTTADDTAMAPDDYTSLTQDLTFNSAVNHVCKNTIIIPDSMNEVAAEQFTISLNSTDRAVVLGQSTTVTIVDHPVVTSNPASRRNVIPGTSITFTIEATGSDLTYQWQKNGRNLIDGTNYSGTTTASLTVMDAMETDEGNFTCVLTNAVNSVTSNAAEMTLLDQPQIIQHPADQLNVNPGLTVMFTITATTAVGALTYQWQLDGSDLSPQTGVTGITTHTLTFTSVQESSEANYSCVVTNARGSVKSNPAQLTILDVPIIITDPQDVVNVIPGHNVTFSMRATGLRLTYTWQQGDGSTLPNNSRFITDNETLIIQDVMLSDPNSYRCVVTNSAGNATSNSANFTLIDPPVISVPPQSTVAEVGSDIEFVCTARGEGTLTFAWTTTVPVGGSSVLTRFNPQDGSETSILSLTNVGANHTGVYVCSVANERGNTPPFQATLTIVEISAIPDRTVTLGTNATFSCSAIGPGDIFYHWNRTILDANGVPMEIGFYNESRVSGQDTSTLMIIDVGVRDRGHYTCFVSFNRTDTRDRTAILSTHAPTILEGPDFINTVMGSDFTLECIAQNNADAPNELQFYWYHNGLSITPSSHIAINLTSENTTRIANSKLVVMQVTESDTGEYQCTVTNRDIVDGVNATASVTVLLPPSEVNHTTVTRELLTLQSVRLTWMQPEDNNGHISSYNITYCILVNSTCGQQTSFQTLSFTEMVILSQLIPARTYQVYIRAENDVGQGPEPTQPFFFKSANQIDAQPVGMNAAFVSATTVVLVWQLPTIGESAGVDSFIVSYSLQEDSEENSTHTRHPSGEAMTHTVSYQQGRTPGVVISGLNSSALYNFTVSINYSSPVLLSAEASVTVHTDPLGSQPSNSITVPPIVQQNLISVMWPLPGGGEFVMNYVLMYTSVSRLDQQTTSGNITISSNQTFYNFTPPILQPYSDYTFVVFGEFEVGKMTQIVAPFTAVSLEAAPSSPVDLQVQGTFHISINLSWSAPLQPNGNIIQYTVYYQPTSVNERSSVAIHNYTPRNTYTLGGLLPNTVYNIRVTASTNGGEGEGVRVANSTTFGVYPPEIASVNPTDDQDTHRMIINSFQTTYGPLSHYKIVIVRGHGSNATNTKTNIPDNTLLPESQSQTSYYVAAATRVEEFQSVFLIGDGQTYLLYSERFVNVPLSIDQEYMVFIRLYSSLNYSLFEDSIPQTFTTTPTSPPVKIEVTVGPIVAVFLFLILLLLILLILVALKRNKRQNAVGAAPSEVELHRQERQGAATKYESETVDIPNPDNREAKETVEEIVML